MDLLPHLWLPILASAAAVWFLSALMWMALPHHRKDYIALPNEQAFTDFARANPIPPGNYMFPHYADHKQCNSPEAKERWKQGPSGTMTIMGNISMGRNMLLTFFVSIIASALMAYLGAITLPRGASFGDVMQVMGTAGVLTYSFAFIPHMVWFASYPRAIAACVFDGIVHGLATGAIFAALWPNAA